ncbi:MAG TPA: hypothetical protein VN965_04130 [Candidatus Dormibacteraeota bacterium]|nr:hypothetical protein [Candidatus Dormibacteraeota bacterium]
MANSPASSDQRTLWAFWLACGLAAVGGVAPLVFGGGSNRLSGAVVPFALAAIALGACALLYRQGRPIATGLYFVASLAIVYGILAMLAVPLRLAVLGTCPPAPAPCGAGLERPLTGGENSALGFAVGIGIVTILTGFFGLVTLYRRLSAPPPSPPPARRIPSLSEKAPATPAPAPPPAPAPQPEPEPEPPADTPPLELAAPVEALELPEVGTEDPAAVAPPAPERKPRKRRAPKAPPEPTATPDTEGSA